MCIWDPQTTLILAILIFFLLIVSLSETICRHLRNIQSVCSYHNTEYAFYTVILNLLESVLVTALKLQFVTHFLRLFVCNNIEIHSLCFCSFACVWIFYCLFCILYLNDIICWFKSLPLNLSKININDAPLKSFK